MRAGAGVWGWGEREGEGEGLSGLRRFLRMIEFLVRVMHSVRVRDRIRDRLS